MSRTNAWMPFFVSDYLADTMHLSTFEHGAYVLLLIHYWRTGPLSPDLAQLARIARVPPHLRASLAVLVQQFFKLSHEDGLLHQKRSDVERAKSNDISIKRAASARNMHEQKESKRNANATASAPANAEHLLPHAGARAIASHLPSKEAGPLTPVSGSPAPLAVADPLKTGMADMITIDGHPCINGFEVDTVFEACCRDARINTVASTATWKPVVEWLRAGYTSGEILWLIRKFAARPDYKPPNTLAYFNAPLRQDCRTGDPPNGKLHWHE